MIFYYKQKDKLDKNEMLAFTLSKIGEFGFCKIKTHSLCDPYGIPPKFIWRYKNIDFVRYQALTDCVNSYRGKVEWVMFKSNKNYIIQPKELYYLEQTNGIKASQPIIEADYRKYIDLAIDDIIGLCEYIEQSFELKGKSPVLPEKYTDESAPDIPK